MLGDVILLRNDSKAAPLYLAMQRLLTPPWLWRIGVLDPDSGLPDRIHQK